MEINKKLIIAIIRGNFLAWKLLILGLQDIVDEVFKLKTMKLIII
jgi:hypothetical protein